MKKLLAIMLTLILTVSALTGCGSSADQTSGSGSEAESNSASKPLDQEARLVYWPMWSETEAQGIVLKEAIEEFTQETGIQVEIHFQESRATRTNLIPALESGTVIDIFDEDIERVNSEWLPYLMDLQELYDNSPLTGQQNATLLNIARHLGGESLHCVPYQPAACVVMYNKDAFDAAGVQAPASWGEFLAVCEALKNEGIAPLTMDDEYMAAFFGYMMDRVVGSAVTAGVAAGDFGNEAVLRTAQVIEDMISKGYIDSRAAVNCWPEGQNHIADSSAAMYLNSTWLPNELREQTGDHFHWGSFALPNIAEGGDGAESNTFTAQCFAINAATQYPREAFALIQWLTSGKWDQELADRTIGVPMDNHAKWPEPLEEAQSCIAHTTQRLSWAVDMEVHPEVKAAIQENLTKMIAGELDAAGFAAAFAQIQIA